MAGIHEYKCPSCGGVLVFDSGLQKMKCPYCDTVIDVADLKDVDKELGRKKQEASGGAGQGASAENSESDSKAGGTEQKNAGSKWSASGREWQEDETTGMRVYVCKSCGGEIIGDENMAATSCPYCGNPVVMMGQFTGDLKPDLVIPFKLDKEAAKAAYLSHIKGKVLLPKLFRIKNHIDEIKGVYVPFWIYDAQAEGQASFEATNIRSWQDSKNRYTETRYYSVEREGRLSFEGVPADGSSKMPDDLMESIEPFDLSQAVDFQTAYLSGYLADRYDVTAEENSDRVTERMKRSMVDQLQSTVTGYNSVQYKQGSVRLKNATYKYALYPVWILNTTYLGGKYLFAMNAQTGKMVGNLPIDKKKLWLFRAIIFVVLGLIGFFVSKYFV